MLLACISFLTAAGSLVWLGPGKHIILCLFLLPTVRMCSGHELFLFCSCFYELKLNLSGRS